MSLLTHKHLSYSTIDLGSKITRHKVLPHAKRELNSYEGQMQQLIINGRSYFELIENGDMANSVNRTVTFLRSDTPHKYPIYFQNAYSWIVMPKIDAYHILLVQFHFKTTHENGLIMYNNGEHGDYLAVELFNGQISYVFSLGSAANTLKSKSKEKLNDNKWHLVSIWRSTKTNHELTVDSIVYKHSSNNNEHTVFNLVDKLYLGGLSEPLDYERLVNRSRIKSTHGFRGCLASVEINGRVPDFDEILNSPGKSSGNVTKGCDSKRLINKRIRFSLKSILN
jgi:neurexin